MAIRDRDDRAIGVLQVLNQAGGPPAAEDEATMEETCRAGGKPIQNR